MMATHKHPGPEKLPGLAPRVCLLNATKTSLIWGFSTASMPAIHALVA